MINWRRLRCESLVIFLLLSHSPAVAIGPATASVSRWAGRWESPSKGHAGSIRMRLRSIDGQHYKGFFTGRFARIVPYAYRANVYRHGDAYYSEKRLGPMGSYRMFLVPSATGLSGGWSAGSQAGSIQLRPLR